MTPVAVAGVLAYAALATAFDLRERRIPNWLSGAALVVAMPTALADGGIGLGPAAVGFAAGLALLVGPFALGVLGGGDVKFVAVAGAWLGPRVGLEALLLGSVAGLVVGAVHATAAGHLRATVRSAGQILWIVAATLSPAHVAPARPERSPLAPIPYALPLALGIAAAVALEQRGASLFA